MHTSVHEIPHSIGEGICALICLNCSSHTVLCCLVPQPVRGSGPWGLPLPGEVRGAVAELQRSMAPHMPRLSAVAALPGAQQARADLLRGLQARRNGSPAPLDAAWVRLKLLTSCWT